MHLVPLGNKYEKILYTKFTETAFSALKGTLIIGGIQGLLGGLMFAFLGIQGAAIWGIIMVFLSILPTGPSLVWLPTAIILLINGQIWQGLTLLFFGLLVISVIDNLLRPILVGKETKLHPLLILFSTLGGIILFGFTGFIIGPILAALVVSMWNIYDDHYKDELLKY
jgi:predicted PurR-regulated permease PerM